MSRKSCKIARSLLMNKGLSYLLSEGLISMNLASLLALTTLSLSLCLLRVPFSIATAQCCSFLCYFERDSVPSRPINLSYEPLPLFHLSATYIFSCEAEPAIFWVHYVAPLGQLCYFSNQLDLNLLSKCSLSVVLFAQLQLRFIYWLSSSPPALQDELILLLKSNFLT